MDLTFLSSDCKNYFALLCFISLLAALCFGIVKRSKTALSKRAELLFVSLAIIGIGLLVYHVFFTGNAYYVYLDAGSDTRDQYMPFYANLINSIKTGQFSLWNFNYGLGASYFVTQTWFCDPFNLILVPGCLLLGTEALPIFLVINQLLRLLICGLIFDRFLVFYCKSPESRVTGSIIYAFSGFMMLWGSHYWFSNGPVWCALILLLVEKALQNRRALNYIVLTLAVALLFICSVYLGVMIMIFTGLYFLIRSAYLMSQFKLKDYLKQLARFCLIALTGMLIAGIVLVPVFQCLVSDSTRIATTGEVSKLTIAFQSLLTFATIPDILVNLTRFIGNDLVGTGLQWNSPFGVTTNYHEMIEIGCSIAVFVCLALFIQWQIKEKLPRGKNALLILAFLLVLAYLTNTFLPQLFNMFSVYALRSSFCLIPLVATMIAFVIDRVIKPRMISLPYLLAGFLVSLMLLGFSLAVGRPLAKINALFSLLILVVFCLCLLLYQKRQGALPFYIALVLIISSSAFNAYTTVNNRTVGIKDTVPLTEINQTDDQTMEALKDIAEHDQGLFRVEKTYWNLSPYEDSFAQYYRGATSYNTVLPKGLQQFFYEMWPHVLHQEQYKAYRQFFKDDYSNYGVLEFLGIKYILSTTELPDTEFTLQEHIGEIYVYRFENADSLGHLYTDTLSEEEFEALPEEQRSSALSQKIILANSKTSSVPLDANATLIKQPIELQLVNDGYLTGSYSSSGRAIGAISIPLNKGWTVYVDGKAVESYAANYGFIGFDAEPGTHTLELRYEPAGWKVGLILSCIGVVLFLLQIVYWKRSKRPAHAR